MGLLDKFRKDRGGQRSEAPATLDSQPEGREATPPSRDPDHPAAPGPGATERTDQSSSHVPDPGPPEGLARP